MCAFSTVLSERQAPVTPIMQLHSWQYIKINSHLENSYCSWVSLGGGGGTDTSCKESCTYLNPKWQQRTQLQKWLFTMTKSIHELIIEAVQLQKGSLTWTEFLSVCFQINNLIKFTVLKIKFELTHLLILHLN